MSLPKERDDTRQVVEMAVWRAQRNPISDAPGPVARGSVSLRELYHQYLMHMPWDPVVNGQYASRVFTLDEALASALSGPQIGANDTHFASDVSEAPNETLEMPAPTREEFDAKLSNSELRLERSFDHFRMEMKQSGEKVERSLRESREQFDRSLQAYRNENTALAAEIRAALVRVDSRDELMSSP